MSEQIKDAREVSPDLTPGLKKRTTPGFGPGFVNMAIPDRGHMPSLLAMEFDNAGAYNAYCAEHSDWLTAFLGTRGDKVFVLFQVLKSDLEAEEMQLVARYTEEKMSEYRQKRREQEELEAKAKRERDEADTECIRIGRFCIEAHGTFVKELPGLSKIKAIRKNIADDILAAVVDSITAYAKDGQASVEVATKKLQKILEKYVKEGAK